MDIWTLFILQCGLLHDTAKQRVLAPEILNFDAAPQATAKTTNNQTGSSLKLIWTYLKYSLFTRRFKGRPLTSQSSELQAT